jgi:AraC-like DNA-binding protein
MYLTPSEEEIIEKIFIEITTDFMKSFSIADICQRYHIGEFKLKKGFKSLYNTTPYRYRLELCMDHARKELVKGRKVSDLAALYNYSTVGNFTRAFKKVYPNAPSLYKYFEITT